ncbi:hypothetical protein [Corynebacterium nasicanis]|uniref:Uncharacterized protein n=1 Tax=Corynebacterium nasicanis TaxID=1448267 RepID=A0ABW1QE04_9CORY
MDVLSVGSQPLLIDYGEINPEGGVDHIFWDPTDSPDQIGSKSTVVKSLIRSEKFLVTEVYVTSFQSESAGSIRDLKLLNCTLGNRHETECKVEEISDSSWVVSAELPAESYRVLQVVFSDRFGETGRVFQSTWIL